MGKLQGAVLGFNSGMETQNLKGLSADFEEFDVPNSENLIIVNTEYVSGSTYKPNICTLAIFNDDDNAIPNTYEEIESTQIYSTYYLYREENLNTPFNFSDFKNTKPINEGVISIKSTNKIYSVNSDLNVLKNPLNWGYFRTLPFEYINNNENLFVPTGFKYFFPTWDAFLKYKENKDPSGAWEFPPIIECKAYYDGAKLPSIKITWDVLQSNEAQKEMLNNATVEFYVNDALSINLILPISTLKKLTEIPFVNGSYKTNYQSLINLMYKNWFDKILTGGKFPIQLLWRIKYDTDKYSTMFYVDGGYTTPVSSYGSVTWDASLNPNIISGTEGLVAVGNGSIIVIYGNGENDEGYTPIDDILQNVVNTSNNIAEIIGVTTPYSGVGVLTKTYALTTAKINQLGAFLWGADFFENIKLLNNSPIENILALKILPIALSGATQNIVIGNVDTNVTAEIITAQSHVVNLGTIKVEEYYHSFFDYAPFTKLSIYLPFIGYKELDVNEFMNSTLGVSYYIDIITGNCKAVITSNGYPLNEFDGVVGIDIPITASNRSQVEAGYISSMVGSVADFTSGNVIGAIGSLINSAMTPYHYSTSGTNTPSCASQVGRACFIILDRPTYQNLSAFNHTKGRLCNLSKNIGSLHGFTMCDSNIDLSGINCTDTEREELRSILSSGFYA